MNEYAYDLIVVGGGPAGMAAALEAYKHGVKRILILERAETLGGILEQCIHTGFGLHYFGEELSGPEYAARFIRELGQSGIEVRTGAMVLHVSRDRMVTAVSREYGHMELKAGAVILAMGCRERPRGALNIAGSRPAGVMTAGTAQKFVNIDGYLPGREVVILGSGDIGLIMARRMTLEGAHVKLVCEVMPYSGGLTRNIVQCLEDFNIPLRLSCTVVSIHGQGRLSGVTVAQVDENRRPVPGSEEFIPCDTLLLSVGLIPENELSREVGIPLDCVTGGPVVDETMETGVTGIFACGNVVQVHDLVDYVTLESQAAGRGAAAFLLQQRQKAEEPVAVEGKNGVRYVVPQSLHKTGLEKVKFFFRVDRVYESSAIVVRQGERELLVRKRPKMTPGEMESLVLGSKQLALLEPGCPVTVEVRV